MQSSHGACGNSRIFRLAKSRRIHRATRTTPNVTASTRHACLSRTAAECSSDVAFPLCGIAVSDRAMACWRALAEFNSIERPLSLLRTDVLLHSRSRTGVLANKSSSDHCRIKTSVICLRFTGVGTTVVGEVQPLLEASANGGFGPAPPTIRSAGECSHRRLGRHPQQPQRIPGPQQERMSSRRRRVMPR